MPSVPGLLQPETQYPWQDTAEPCLPRRHENTQRQVWPSLCGVSGSWCTQGFVWALPGSLVGMGFVSKNNFAPSTILLGLLLCPWTWGIFFWWDPTFSCLWLFSSELQFWSSCRRWVQILLLCHLSTYPYPSEGKQKENHNHSKLMRLITWITALSNSMKLWPMLCRATQDGWVMVENSDKMWSTGEGNGKPLQYSFLENPMKSMKRQKDMTLKDELLRSIGTQCAICME